MTARFESFERHGVYLRLRWGKRRWSVAYGEILTAERMAAPRRGIRLHTVTSEPIDVWCGHDRLFYESELRARGVRVVDCWGCLLTPTLADFEEELMNVPARMRQSSDDA